MKVLIAVMLIIISIQASADLTLYRGLATTHLFENNSKLNNNNGVTILKHDAWLAGWMTNSYGEDGYFFGWQPEIWSRGRFSFDAGLTAVAGYRRWQLVYVDNIDSERQYEKVLTALPIFSVRYEVVDKISMQINNMGNVVNGGIRIDF